MRDTTLHRIADLIGEGRLLRALWADQYGPPEDAREDRASRTARWSLSCEHFFDFVGLHEFRKRFVETQANGSYPSYQFAQLVGILESAEEQIKAGFVGRMIHMVHADVFGSVIEQAQELLHVGHVSPAAVLGRIVVEGWLRDEADRAGIGDYDTAKASVLNDKLKGLGVLSVPRWRLVQGYLDVGNAAAHGRAQDFTADQVRQLLEFAQVNCI